jgi:hypothetical protein
VYLRAVCLRDNNISVLTESVLVDGREMHENVLRPIIRGDEAEALVREKFDLSGASHVDCLVVVLKLKAKKIR